MQSKRMPVHSIERSFKTAGLFLRLGRNSSRAMLGDLLRGQRPDVKSAVVSRRNVEGAVQSLKSLRGAAMKFGQLISLDETLVLSPELAEILAQLRASGYAMPPRQLKQVLNEHWGRGWLQHFSHFEVEPFAAASIGQVHRAVLHTGEELAIKVQFPNIAQTIEGDLKLLQFFIKNAGVMPPDLDLDYYINACKEVLLEETDYVREAQNMARFQTLLAGHSNIALPKVYPTLSSHQVLAMSFEEGTSLSPISSLSMAQREAIGRELMDLLLAEIFGFRFVQTDPNIANFMQNTSNGGLTILDFGACCEVSDESYQIYIDLLGLALEGNTARLKAYLIKNGLLPEAMEAAGAEVIEAVISGLLKQLHDGEMFNFSDMPVFDLLLEQELDLYTALTPNQSISPDLMFIQRKVVGFLLLFKSMGIRLPVLPRLQEYAARLNIHQRFT